MPRQLQGKHAPYPGTMVVAPVAKGGTGQTTPKAGTEALGGIHISDYLKPFGIIQADDNGRLPTSALGENGQSIGYSIEGPLSLIYGQVAMYRITNYNSSAPPSVSITAGQVSITGRDITITAPTMGDRVTLTVGTRKIVIPVSAFGPARPTILYPEGSHLSRRMTVRSTPFRSEPSTVTDWVAVSAVSGSITIPKNAYAIELKGRAGRSGVAKIVMAGKTYLLGISSTQRQIAITNETSVSPTVSGTGEFQYRFISPTALHLSSDWEIATDANFANIIKSSYGDTVNLTSWEVMLQNGDYYARVRYNGRLFGFGQPYEPTIIAPAPDTTINDQTVFQTSAFTTPSRDAHLSSDWEVSTSPSFATIAKSSYGDTTNKLSWKVSGLAPNTIHYVRVRHNGETYKPGEWSSVVSFKT